MRSDAIVVENTYYTRYIIIRMYTGMNFIFQEIRRRRTLAGLTQQQLADRAGLCLATLQNIESNKANPTLDVLDSIFSTLGIEFSIRGSSPDWNVLIGLGVPLFGTSSVAPTLELLVSQLRKLSHFSGPFDDSTRESSALRAWLSAIEGHYPSLAREIPLKMRGCGLHVSPKLRRIALEKLAKYL